MYLVVYTCSFMHANACKVIIDMQHTESNLSSQYTTTTQGAGTVLTLAHGRCYYQASLCTKYDISVVKLKHSVYKFTAQLKDKQKLE